jgi:dephospho-CoA kinase
MLVIGIVGGVASGKSAVADHFRSLGAEVIDADRVGHEVLGESAVIEAARGRWGETILGDDGQIDRTALAQIVFAPAPEGPKQLAYLEQLTHPRIAERVRHEIATARATGRVPAVVLDAAVLLKAGWHRFCDKILFVDTPPEIRRQRARQRGWTDEAWKTREARQPPLSAQRAIADFVIDNRGCRGQIQAQVQRIWASFSQ